MDYLAENIKSIPGRLLQLTLEAFCSHLRQPQDATFGSIYPSIAVVERARTALWGLAALLDNEVTRDKLPQLISTLMNTWMGVKFWLVYLATYHRGEPVESSRSALIQDTETLACVLIENLLACDDSDLCALILSEKGVFRLVSTFWLQQDTKLDYGKDSPKEKFVHTYASLPSKLLTLFLHKNANGIDANRFLKMAGDDKDLISASVVQRTRRALNAGAEAIYDLERYATLMYILSRHEPTGFAISIADNGGVHMATKSLRKVLAWDHIKSIRRNIALSAEVQLCFLTQAFRLAPSPKYIKQSIHSGLLAALGTVFSNDVVSDRSKEGALQITENMVSCRLLISSVVGELAHACRTMPAAIASDLSFSYRNSWDRLTSLVVERAIFKRLYDRGSVVPYSSCYTVSVHVRFICQVVRTSAQSFAQCDKVSQHHNLLKCGACQNIRYCSLACQGAHWNVHKTMCNAWNMQNPGV